MNPHLHFECICSCALFVVSHFHFFSSKFQPDPDLMKVPTLRTSDFMRYLLMFRKDKPRDYNLKENEQNLLQFISNLHLGDGTKTKQLGVLIFSLPYCWRHIRESLRNAGIGKKKARALTSLFDNSFFFPC